MASSFSNQLKVLREAPLSQNRRIFRKVSNSPWNVANPIFFKSLFKTDLFISVKVVANNNDDDDEEGVVEAGDGETNVGNHHWGRRASPLHCNLPQNPFNVIKECNAACSRSSAVNCLECSALVCNLPLVSSSVRGCPSFRNLKTLLDAKGEN